MLIFRVPEKGGFQNARETHDRRHPIMRPLPPSEKSRGLVILASAKRLCGYYEDGARAEDEPRGGLTEPAKHWFFVFGRTCVLFFDPWHALFDAIGIAVLVLMIVAPLHVAIRIFAGVFLAAVLFGVAKRFGEQFMIKGLIKGEGREELP